ncbi:hypothetical protein ES731_15440 [Psychroflexus gondwanensis]|uniref:hypothetical protein n=1 Tax=Psychroflexus gondwanensis TaxID=251 RepID=UPI0011BE4697|nr:hypothetical protein [Psychroflexus gondwanensis]TXE15336.1 hypothetical protein ES731_15440 [Psychroflexus gondwanensis]
MRNIDHLLKELIPPSDYQHRNGFSNEHVVLSLTENEKTEVERNLIEMLEKKEDDLIGETLTIMKSTDSLSTMRKRLNLSQSPTMKIIWASYINQIKSGDEEMKEIALNEFDKVSEKYSIIGIFHHLAKFCDSRINDKIRNYINDKDYLIAYNARTSLGIDTAEIINREQIKNGIGIKKWWEIWK